MNPSLLLIPDRYKAAKLYSQIPDSGAGDLTFARNSNATRVNSAGLIEKVRTNNYLYSNTFTDAAWTNLRMNFTASAAANPLTGTNDAFKAIPSTDSGIHAIRQTIVYGVLSIYAKKGENEKIGFRDDGDTGFYATFNLDTGVLIEKSASALASITALSGGWYRVQFAVPTSSSKLAGIYFLDNAYTSGSPVSDTYAGNGTDGLFIYASQAETGDIATDYIPTTTAAVSVGITADIPRLDYTGGGCPSLLLEPQRTNLALYSEQFDNAAWQKNNLTITANNLVSPDGYTNADTALETTTNGFHDLLQSPSLTSGTTYTLSSFVKAAGRDYCYLFLSDGTTPAAVKFDLATGVVLGTALGSPVSSKIENYGNGWYRCSIVYTSAATATGTLAVSAINSPALSLSAYAGDITKGIAVYGAQLEAGSYPTSYIPTLGSSVTRLADAASKTGISSLIGQTAGTIYWEFEFTTSAAANHEALLNIDNGSFGNTIYISKGTAGAIAAEMYTGSVVQASFSLSSQPVGTYKCAFGYENNNTAFFINGVQVGATDTSCSVPTTSRIQLGNGILGPSTDGTKTVALYTTRLSNSELAQLTAL
jgi:hypothetical protein